MKVKVMYYDKRYNNKPDVWETVKIQGYTSKSDGVYHNPLLVGTEIEIEELAKGLSEGATFKPAYLSGSKNDSWVSQQIFALDFDHDAEIERELNKCKALGIMPCFGYTSFSHSQSENHFRIVFCTDEVITDIDTRNKLQATLIEMFSNSDDKTKDPSRLFYGGRSLIYEGYENRINADSIIEKYCTSYSAKPAQNAHYNDCYQNDEESENIEAIKTLNVAKMKDLLKVHTDKEDNLYISMDIQLKSDKEMHDYINSIDLQEYLGIYGNVCCILPDHQDHTPSAHVYTTDDGTQVYKCFGCNHSYTIVSITEKLARVGYHKAIDFIKKVYNLELVQSDWVMKQKQLMIDSANYLDSDDFKVTFPALSKLIRTRKHHIKAMLLHFSQYVNDDMKDNGKPFFYAGYNMLMDICGIKGDRNALSQSLTLCALLNMITKLQIEDIPEKELNKAREIAAQYHLKKLTGFYSFEEYGTMLFEESENIAKTLKKNNITLKGLSREYIIRTFGPALADKVYPQYKNENRKGNSIKSDEHTLDITECLFYLLDTKGYATEKELVHMLGNKYAYDQTEIQIKKSLQEIMLSYGLVRVKASKANKQKYGITDDEISYQANIICRDIT
jgi:hypothetical protein